MKFKTSSFSLVLIASAALLSANVNAQKSRDGALSTIRRSDSSTKDAGGKLPRLSPSEHMRRASVYMSNRAFPEARAHWQALIDFYPADPRIPEALFGIARSYFQQKVYDQALPAFERVARDFPATKEGREALNYSAATLLRLERFNEAVAGYIEYIDRYPNGERIETAHLNVIDTLREAGRAREALDWVAKTRTRFSGSVTETNAVFAKLRLHVAEGQWRDAIATADLLRTFPFQKGVAAKPDEVTYLKGFSLEQSGRKDEAFTVYAQIPDNVNSYFGWLATERMMALARGNERSIIDDRRQRVNSDISDVAGDYPAPYRTIILRATKTRNFDPRFVLALMKQESVFKPTAKSPAGARGLLQLTLDAAQKYAPAVGLTGVQESQLYEPDASIRLGVEYLSQLASMFPQMLEPVAASYNGGEDNAARWLKRSRQKNPGVFTAEVGFEETKDYVQKVMSNYRVYRQLYTADLLRK